MQMTHRSQAHFEGEKLEDLLIRQHKLLKWDDRYKQYIQDTALYGIIQIGSIKVDYSLISALVERWRSETHTFHLPVGEMTVTLEDVAIMVGLPVNEEPYKWSARHTWKKSRNHSLSCYRNKIDMLRDENVAWTPYPHDTGSVQKGSCANSADFRLCRRQHTLLLTHFIQLKGGLAQGKTGQLITISTSMNGLDERIQLYTRKGHMIRPCTRQCT